MGRKTGYGERNRGKMNFPVAHGQWGKKRICGNCGSIRRMSRHATIHGTLGLILSRRKSGVRFWRRRTVMVLMLRAVTVVCCHGHCMA
jgi:hypothetical protein